MKLSTMLLPTGEFILVVSGTPDHFGWDFGSLKEMCGAAGVFVTNQPVEVKDALYDENARRRDELPGVWQDLGYLDEGDEILGFQFDNGAEFSPAGLVKTPAPEDPFTPGTRVEIVGPSTFEHNEEPWPGRFGVVVHTGREDLGPVVESEEIPEGFDFPIRWFFPKSSLQPVPSTLEGTDEGDED